MRVTMPHNLDKISCEENMTLAGNGDSRYWNDYWEEATRPSKNRGPMQAGFWNSMAGKYERNQDQKRREERVNQIITMIERSGLDLNGAEVLDIGAGTGSVAIPLAKLGARVTAIDFSDSMLTQLTERAERENVPISRVLHLNWDEVDLDTYNLRGAFDLVIASMTPAVRCPNTFRRMLDAGRGVYYYIGWVNRRWDPSYYELYKTLFNEDFKEGMHGFHLPFMSLYLEGYRPVVQLSQDVWSNDESIDEVVESVVGFFHTSREIDETMKKQIREYYQARAVDGRYQTETIATTGMMVWNKNHNGISEG